MVQSGSVGGVLAEIYGTSITGGGAALFYYYWSGAVSPEDPFEIGTPFSFEFSNDAINVIAAWAGAEDASPP